jgi:hypothetical protein
MSAYVYSLTSKTTPIKYNGAIHQAGVLKYAYKPLYSCFWESKEPRWQILAKARIARISNIWRKRGYTPKYVVIVSDKGVTQDCPVLDWHSTSLIDAVSTYDDPDWGGRKFIGKLASNSFDVVEFNEIG